MKTDKKKLADFWPILETRNRLMASLRGYFESQGYLEVDTPVRVAAPLPEDHIEAPACGSLYLRPSPELHMKRLLCAGYKSIYQVGPCFRQGESGAIHREEFTMLEWYRVGSDYRDILEETRELLQLAAYAAIGSTKIPYQGTLVDLEKPWNIIPVRDAFLDHAGWDPTFNYDPDRFDLDLVNLVEPALSRGVPVVLMDYPIEAGALARAKRDNRQVAERWELYLSGIEIANAFSELTQFEEQAHRFNQSRRRREQAGLSNYPESTDFLDALKGGMPEASGIALGIDRLLMFLCDKTTLADVLPFSD